MKTVLSMFVGVAALLVSGCYTELTTLEPSDRTEYYDSDTVTEEGITTINNNYYLDDEYRRSRLRVSFNYYYPSYSSSWIGGYYNSYFNDPYWGMYHRPFWYHDPYMPFYHPFPYYDPWYPYYHPIAYYPVYYPYPVYYGGPVTVAGTNVPTRPRTDGPTRDPGPGVRDRPLPTPVITPVTADGGGSANEPEVNRPRPVREPEKGWWEKDGTERPSITPTTRPTRPTNIARPSIVNEPRRPAANDPKTDEAPPRPVGRPAADDPKNNDRPNRPSGRPAQVDRPNDAPVYTPPAKKPTQKNDGETSRPRESSRPSYTPPPQQSAPQSTPPQSAPPRNSGGSNGNGRSRD